MIMQDTLLLCQVILGDTTLRGYRVAEQYWIVALGVRPTPLPLIFNFFEDMNQLWHELKNSSVEQVHAQLSGRNPGLQVSKPRKKSLDAPPRTSFQDRDRSFVSRDETKPRVERTEDRPTRPVPKPRVK